MKINHKQFMDVLTKAMAGVEDKEMSFSNTLTFKNGYVNTFRDVIAVSVFVSDEFKEITGSVKASEFFKLLGKMSGDELEITRADQSIKVVCGKSEAEFALVVELGAVALELPDIEGLNKLPLPKNFLPALNYCKLGCDDGFRYNGIYFDDKAAVSTDGRRINEFVLDVAVPKFMISDKAALQLMKMDDADAFALSDSRLFLFLPSGSIVSAQRIQIGDYPVKSIRDILTRYTFHEGDFQSELPEAFKAMVDRAQVLSSGIGDNKSVVTIKLSSKGIEVVSKKDSGKYKEQMDWKKGQELQMEGTIEITLDISLLFYALSRSQKFYVSDIDGVQRVVFTGESCQCLLATVSKKE